MQLIPIACVSIAPVNVGMWAECVDRKTSANCANAIGAATNITRVNALHRPVIPVSPVTVMQTLIIPPASWAM